MTEKKLISEYRRMRRSSNKIRSGVWRSEGFSKDDTNREAGRSVTKLTYQIDEILDSLYAIEIGKKVLERIRR